jgi:L-threonylcarbamoyladenylate synthase
MGVVDEAVAALRAGGLAILPTDTVYGLAAIAFDGEAARRLRVLKRKPEGSPLAIVAADVEGLLDVVLDGRDATIARTLLPGPYTLVLENPARRFPWLCGTTPEAIGVRVPVLGSEPAAIVRRVGAVTATSANLHGGRDPRTLAEVPGEIAAGCDVLVDGGELPGTASTVLDFTAEPRVIREGAAPSGEAIDRALAATR